jgi:hypothetical protein
MDKATHFAALRAAARVAFGVIVLGGCSAAAEKEDAVANESEINAKDPCPSKADSGPAPDATPTKPSCDTVLASAFPDGGDDFAASQDPNAKLVSDDVKACCEEHLTQDDETWNLQYRWSCCGVLDSWNNPNQKISIACTPWGPPVPPKMKAVA